MLHRTLSLSIFLLLAGITCFGQSSFQGLTPGESRRGEVAGVLGQPVRSVSQTRAEHAPPQGLGKIYVEYREGSEVVERIEIHLLKPVTRAALVQKFKLPNKADARETSEGGKLVEYFDGSNLIAFVYVTGDEASGVGHIVHYSLGLLMQAVNTLGQTVQRTVDRTGNIIERTLDTAGNVVSQRSMGSVSGLKVQGETTNAVGQTLRRVVDTSGAIIELTLNSAGRTISTRVVSMQVE